MWKPKKAAKTILNSLLAKDPKFKTSNAKIVYRAISLTKKQVKELKETGSLAPRGQVDFLPFSESKESASAAASDFEYENRLILLFQKPLKKDDILLNFSKFAKHVGSYNVTSDEHELWMKPTSHYTTFTLKDLVSGEQKVLDND